MNKKEHTNPSFRVEKINELIKEVLSEIIPSYLDGASGITTVMNVETSRDLKHAMVWISNVGGNVNTALRLLNDDIYEIQGSLNTRLNMKVFPRIKFTNDSSGEYAQHINELIQEIHNEDAK